MWVRRDIRFARETSIEVIRDAIAKACRVPVECVIKLPRPNDVAYTPGEVGVVTFYPRTLPRGLPYGVTVRVQSRPAQTIPDEAAFAAAMARELRQNVVADLPEDLWAEGFWLLAQYDPDAEGNVRLWVVPEAYDSEGESDDIADHGKWRAFSPPPSRRGSQSENLRVS
jgi:hypothetical protein